MGIDRYVFFSFLRYVFLPFSRGVFAGGVPNVCLTFVCVPNVPSFSCVFHVKMRVFNTLNAWSRLECSERGFSESKILCE